MDLTWKQKIIVFSAMLVIFMGSVFLKHWLDSGGVGGTGEAVASGTGESLIAVQGEERESEDASETEMMIIDVEGAVLYPGIVKLEEGSRVYEAVEEAGGLLDDADTKYVNLAQEVKDGSIVYIPFRGEEESAGKEDTGIQGGGKININTAGISELMELPGIGEAYAQAIIDYREKEGAFVNPEDLMQVSGIGEAKYRKIQDYICVY